MGKDLKPVPVSLTVEFLDTTGKVLGSQAVDIPALEPGATHAVKAETRQAGVTGWRYVRK